MERSEATSPILLAAVAAQPLARHFEEGGSGAREGPVAAIDGAVPDRQLPCERDRANPIEGGLEHHLGYERDAEPDADVALDDLEARELERDLEWDARPAQIVLDEPAGETLLAEEDQGFRGDFRDVDLGLRRERMPFRDDADEALGIERLRAQPVVLLGQRNDRKVDLTVDDPRDDRRRVPTLDRELDPRVRLAERLELGST